MAQLLQELIIEILLRSPAKSLLRFRCVSKSICAVIDGHDFINSHLTRSSQNLYLRKLIFQQKSTNQFHVFDVNVDLEEEILRIEEEPFSSLWNEVYGYCKGLLLLTRRSSQFGLTLWNPSTRRRRDLPDCPVQASANLRVYIIGSGLGYDESTDDYKTLFIVYIQGEVDDDDCEIQVWIYGLKSNIWRRSQDFPYLGCTFPNYLGFAGFGYFADGIMYWLILKPYEGCQLEIVSFDVKKETFSLVPQPVCSMNSMDGVTKKKLHLLEGCLCMSYYFASSTSLQADLYVRKRDGVDRFTWAQLYSVKEPLFFNTWFLVKVLGYSKGRDKILLDVNMDYMVSYDLKEKRFGKVEIDKDPNWNDPFLCVESLVSLGDDGA